MRHLIGVSFITAAAVVLMSGSAFALSTKHSFVNLTGLGPDGNIVGNTIDTLAIGDRFEVLIELDNTSFDRIRAIFTHLTYDNSAINIVDGFTNVGSIVEPGFNCNILTFLGALEDALGEPAGTAIGIALGVSNPTASDGFFSSFVSDALVLAIFEVVGLGTTSIDHVDTGYTVFRDRASGADGVLEFSAPLLVVVPEPRVQPCCSGSA